MKKRVLMTISAFVLTLFVGLSNVFAVGNSVVFHKRTLNVTKQPNVPGTYYKWVDGDGSAIAYCVSARKMHPGDGAIISKAEEMTTAQMVFFLTEGFNGSTYNTRYMPAGLTADQAYYATQMAIWLYQGSITVNDINQRDAVGAAAVSLYNYSAQTGLSNSWLNIAIAGLDLKYDAANNRYISDEMHVVGNNFSSYKLTLENAPAGSYLAKADGTRINTGTNYNFPGNGESDRFYFIVPASSVSGALNNIKISVDVTYSTTKVFKYRAADATKQELGILIPTYEPASASHTFKLNPPKKQLTCQSIVDELLAKYPSNRTKANANYMTDLNNAKTKATQNSFAIYTSLGVDKPSCAKPTCPEMEAYLNSFSNKSSSNAEYMEALKDGKDNYGINTDAGLAKPSCAKPTCEQVEAYLKSFENRNENNAEYISELSRLKDIYGINTDAGIDSPSCKPLPGCEDSVAALIRKYSDRTETNTAYITELNELKKRYPIYGDIANPSCTKPQEKILTITKIDKNTGVPLAGAELAIKDAQGNIVRQWISTNEAYVITDLPAGSYVLKELNPPAGYDLAEAEIPFELVGDSYSINLTLENVPTEEPIVTADMNFVLMISAFIIFLGFGIFGLIRTSKAEEI